MSDQTVTAVRLSADDWVRAALDTMVDEGIGGVKIQRLCDRLGVTKGSFYWHFADRDALVAAALAVWEQQSTEARISALDADPDPVARRRQLRPPLRAG